jgi:hypothetical protein
LYWLSGIVMIRLLVGRSPPQDQICQCLTLNPFRTMLNSLHFPVSRPSAYRTDLTSYPSQVVSTLVSTEQTLPTLHTSISISSPISSHSSPLPFLSFLTLSIQTPTTTSHSYPAPHYPSMPVYYPQISKQSRHIFPMAVSLRNNRLKSP